MKKITYAIICLVAIWAVALPVLTVSGTTYVYDIPNGYTTWTAADSPYSLTSNLVIENGETLNIQSGVVVHLNGYQIQVYGLLNAQGSSANKIYFLSDGFSNSQIIFKAQSSTSCAIDYGVFYSVPITVEGGAPRIANSYLTGTTSSAVITVNSGAASITGNVISTQNAQDGIHINSGLVTISGNTISGAQYGCGIYNTGSTAPIADNTIVNWFSGIYTTQPVTIQQNIIANTVNDGINTQDTHGVTISNNAIAYNNVGVSQDANIQNNTIAHNNFGLWGQTSSSTIHYNNILDSTTESVHLTETAMNVDATNNWWGTTDETSISQTISDFRFDSHLGNVTFTPFLTQPADAPVVPTSIVIPTPPPTPTATPTATPTPTPTSATSTATSEPTASPTISATPYTPYTPDPYQTTTPNPYLTIQPTDAPLFGGFVETDVITAVVILVSVCFAVLIIVVIRRAGQTNKQQAKTSRHK